MSEYKIQLGVQVKTDEIRTQISKFQNNNLAKIKLSIDKKHIDSQLNSIRKQIQNLSNIKIKLNLGGTGTGTGNTKNIQTTVSEVNKAYTDLIKLSQRIQSIRLQIAPLDATKNSSQIKELSGQLNRLMTDYNNLYQTYNRRFSTDQIDSLTRAFDVANGKISSLNAKMSDTSVQQRQKQANAELKKSYQDLMNMANQISNLEAKIGKLKLAGGNVNQIEVLEAKLKSLKATYDSLANSFAGKGALTSGLFNVGDITKLNNAVNQGKAKLNELEAEYEDTRAKLARNLEIKLNEGKFSAQVAKVNSDAKRLSGVSAELKVKLTDLRTAEQAMGTAFKSGSVDQKIAAYQRYERALESVKNQLKENQIAEQQTNNLTALNQSKEQLSLKMSNWLRDNSAAAKQFGGEIRNLQAQLKSCNNGADVRNISRQFDTVKLKAKEAGVATQTFGDKLKTQFSKYSSYLSVASVFMYTTRALRDMFNQVKAIDSAMTELKKVTDETAASYDKFLTNAASRAKEIGTTIDGLVSSTADFARLGYGFEDAQGLAEVANIYAVVGDEVEGVEGATESLISTMAAFKDEASNLSNTDFATSIIDKFNEIGNNFAISSGGIGEAMKRSASSLDAANNSIDESIALITAANTVVQNPDKVGRLLPTIKMAISVKLQRWTRPRKDFISIFGIRQLGKAYIFYAF